MQLTRAVDYGIRALVLMARNPLGMRYFLQDLAREGDLPRNYLVKVLKSLASHGIVRSHRGIKGGFSLGRNPAEISLRAVVEAIDGPVSIMHCLTDKNSCSFTGHCAVQVFFAEMRQRILADLQSKTLQDLIELQEHLDQGSCPAGGSEMHDMVGCCQHADALQPAD
jgi:Rrf2 family iron-sulfur cluster assembly transcriptional regulator